MRRSRVRRSVASLVIVGAVMAALAAPAAAVEPIDLRDDYGTRQTLPPRSGTGPASTPPPVVPPTPAPASEPPLPEHGLDVSYPQCDDELPDAFAFAIVGVNGGRVYSPNPCLGAAPSAQPPADSGQLAWAGREVELYANTGNPGPNVSRFWPDGEERPDAATQPRACERGGLLASRDTVDCAYVYGWNAAADSYRTALDAFVSIGWAEAGATALPWPTTWWLDVETANSWRLDWRMNVAALEGARDYLVSRDVAEVGFYSTPLMWWRITGGTEAFVDHPAWHAGASDGADARRRCAEETPFTGGELRMVQWVEDGLDHNIRCEDVE